MSKANYPRLSWKPKPAEWPAIPNFDGSVTAETEWGSYGVHAVAPETFQARFRPVGADYWQSLEQHGQSRRAAYDGVRVHLHAVWDEQRAGNDVATQVQGKLTDRRPDVS